MEAELESYQFQLSQVSVALEADPTNAELGALKAELEQIIDLTKEALGVSSSTSSSAPVAGPSSVPTSSAASTSKAKDSPLAKRPTAGQESKKQFRAGEDVSAKYKDGKWYQAKVTAVSGAAESPVYTVVFKGYSTPTTLSSSQLRVLTANNVQPTPEPAKRKPDDGLDEREREKRKKKNEKWTQTMNERTQATMEKKSAWETFGKKAAKKGVKIAGLQGKSVFRSPDNPMGKVGVVGSGQGVTSYEQRGKHKFDAAGRPSGEAE